MGKRRSLATLAGLRERTCLVPLSCSSTLDWTLYLPPRRCGSSKGMRLKALVPALQKDFPEAPDVVKALDNLGIKTSFDLLFSSSQYITYGRLPADLISYTSFNAFWEAVITATAATGEAGDVAYDRETQVEEGRFGGETGVEELDTLTSGILGCYGIVEISGVAIQQLVRRTFQDAS